MNGKVSIPRAKLYGKFIEQLAAEGQTGPKAEAAALARVNEAQKDK